MMPVMNGWQFLEERRHDLKLAEIPVVVMTAAGEVDLPRGTAVRVLRKPVGYDDLLSALAGRVPLRAVTAR